MNPNAAQSRADAIKARRADEGTLHTPEHLRDAGLAQVEQHADPRTIAHIDMLIEAANDAGRHWSANDIRAQLPVVSQGLVGNRVRSALMRGHMVQVGEVKSSSGPTHAKKIGVYIGAEFAEQVAS